MTLAELAQKCDFIIENEGEEEIAFTSVYCCDLLSLVMGRAPAGCAWVTVMGNVNSIAVAVLADVACIILAEGASLDKLALERAKEQGITVLRTTLPVFESALLIHEYCSA